MRLLVLLALVVAPLSAHPHNSSDVSSHRDARLFFSFITIARDSCATGDASFPDGTCYSSKDCSRLGGTASNNRCAKGLGVCCRLTQTCGETIYTNRTYFVNPSSPNKDRTVVNPCRTRVDLIGENVCQLRLDFQTFSLAQPADSSQCNTDSFRITGTTSASVPTICGENAGQHLYVDVDPTSRGPTLEVDTSNAGGKFPRRWAIEVTQIQCDSVERAPTGCRQYHRTTSGFVRSFNFKYPPSTADDIEHNKVQHHLADQNYRVCIQQQSGFCSVRWTPSTAITTTRTFAMTGSYVGAGNSDALGTTNAWVDAYTGPNAAATPLVPCADYVIIPGGSHDLIAAANGAPELKAGQSDRYCGGYFPTVTSTAQPFGLHVKTDGDEPFATDTANMGFSLHYRMQSTGC